MDIRCTREAERILNGKSILHVSLSSRLIPFSRTEYEMTMSVSAHGLLFSGMLEDWLAPRLAANAKEVRTTIRPLFPRVILIRGKELWTLFVPSWREELLCQTRPNRPILDPRRFFWSLAEKL